MDDGAALDRDHLTAELRRRGRAGGDDIDLARTALLLAALDRPRVRLDRYHHHLDTLVAAIGEEADIAGDIDRRCTALRNVLVEQYGYQGDTDTYDDPQNANLMRVIDRRKGLPVALGILYLHIAGARGWPAEGLNFPGHFLIRIDGHNGRRVLDPFEGGRTVEVGALRELLKQATGNPDAELAPDHYAPLADRDILLRLQNNLRIRAMRAEDIGRTAEVLESMVLLTPHRADLWRDLGLLHGHQGHHQAALAALQCYRDTAETERQRYEARALLSELQGQAPSEPST